MNCIVCMETLKIVCTIPNVLQHRIIQMSTKTNDLFEYHQTYVRTSAIDMDESYQGATEPKKRLNNWISRTHSLCCIQWYGLKTLRILNTKEIINRSRHQLIIPWFLEQTIHFKLKITILCKPWSIIECMLLWLWLWFSQERFCITIETSFVVDIFSEKYFNPDIKCIDLPLILFISEHRL